MEMVWVKWLDITDHRHEPGLTVMWQLGVLTSSTHVSNDVECTVLSRLFEDGKWADFTTIPNVNIVEVRPACENFSPELE